MQEDSDKSKIENLRNALYSRKIKIKPNFVLDLNGHKTDIKDNWEQEKKEILPDSSNVFADDGAPKSFSRSVLRLSVVFFVISLCVAVYVYFNGSNIISANNIKIEVVGPTTVKAGEETVLDVAITNNNDTTLQIADLILEYPQGTRSALDSVTPMTHDRVPYDDIPPHTTVRRTIKSILYGEEGTTSHIDMTLEYRIPTAMSVFTKNSAYEVLIGSSPLTLSVDGLKEVNANQDYILTINVASNSEVVVKDVLLNASLPFGYQVVTTTPAPIPKTTVWDLGDIEPKGKRTIVMRGKMYGDHNEERYFKINVGTKDSKAPTQVSGVISALTQQVTIREPFIGVALSFEKNSVASSDYVARAGSTFASNINLKNNLDVPIYDVQLESKVTGPIVMTNSFKPNDGFYDSNTGTIRWNKTYNKSLETILPGNNLDEAYSMSLYRSSIAQSLKINHPTFVTDITVKAKRRLESGVPEDIISTIRKEVKVETVANFSAQITHNTGPIENEGSIPPTVGDKTEYTVTWAVTNTFNELSGAKVTATLPDYVTWTGVVMGAGEKMNYNPDSREVVWDIGGMNAQSNGKEALRQVSFQIGFVPSQSQVQTAPVLVNIANFSARDTFTDTSISGATSALTTELPTDPLYVYEDSQVQSNK